MFFVYVQACVWRGFLVRSPYAPRCGRCDITVRDWRKRLSRHGVYDHALERGAGGARSNRQPHKRHSKNFAARIGNRFMVSCGDRAPGPKKQKISLKVFLRCCWNAGIWMLCAKRKGRLRSYLLTSLKHFLTNERNRALAIKRGEGQRLIPLDEFARARVCRL